MDSLKEFLTPKCFSVVAFIASICHFLCGVRGGPLDILGGGVSDPKKKFMQGIELEKKIPASAWRKKKNSCIFMG